MRIQIVHLSDFHIEHPTDAVLARADAIASAAQSLVSSDHDAVVVLATGDLAYSGTEAQYALVETLLRQLLAKLAASLAERNCHAPISLVVVPGNHDCDFANSGGARDIVTKDVLKEPSKARDASIADVCTGVQTQFFAFRDRVSVNAPQSPLLAPYSEKLVWVHSIPIGAKRITVTCVNTAWLSQKNERLGGLAFPADALPNCDGAELKLVVFHHPYNWLTDTTSRPFRKVVDKQADIVLTGHEHDPDLALVSRASGATTTYVEGGLLQDSRNPDFSSFNVLSIDTDTRLQQYVRFEWDGLHYSRGPWDDDDSAQWTPFRSEPSSGLEPSFSDATRRLLDDPGVPLTHSVAGSLTLSQVFVYPDLREVPASEAIKDRSRLVPGELVVDLVCRDRGAILITGDGQAGKTALAKMLMRDLLPQGRVPLLLNGSVGLPQKKNVERALEDAFARQYENGDRESFRQMPVSRRVVIIDDYHAVGGKRATKEAMLEALLSVCGRVVLLANDVLYSAEALTRPDASVSLDRYRIQPFGHLRRNRLVERWILLGRDDDSDTGEFVRTLTNVTRTIDSIIGNNFVPSYPAYVLAVLQATDAATQVDLGASTHGYFYELFIRTALARGRTSVQFDIMMAYLAHLAHGFLSRGRPLVGGEHLRAIHAEYETKHDLPLDFERTIDLLVDQQILIRAADEVQFKYRYVYYYFAAAYLRDHLAEDVVRTRIEELARSIHIEENANILLFLAHLSRDAVIVEELLKAARACYTTAPLARLDEDVASVAGYAKAVSSSLVFRDVDVSSERELMLKNLDRQEVEGALEPSSDPNDPIVRLSIALKSLQILGQVAKNFPGSLTALEKSEIITECCNLGLRTLGALLQLVDASKVSLMQEIVNALQERHPKHDRERLLDRAQDVIASLTTQAAFGVIKRVSRAIGSPNLAPTYDRVFAQNMTPAGALIRVSVDLDHLGVFPMARVKAGASQMSSFPMALWVLQNLATQHFCLFPIDFREKQAACAALGIRYEQLDATPPRIRMLGR